jgi:hypothetical protein
VDFLKRLQLAGAPVSVQMMGKTTEGREMPLAIASFPPVSSAAEARRLNKPIVFIQANIHAGEVEGKEAALAILRRLSQAGPKGPLGKIVLLVAPIYNADGNEKWGPVQRNRPEQDGPPLVGVRPNGQGFDLNRDAVKAMSPEMQGLLRHVYNTWDPDVMMDLHTTNGTRHGYDLTYSPPLNPNTDPKVMHLARDVILPGIRKSFKKPLFDYGNAERRENIQSWYTFGVEGRYCTNYVGLRNRIAILSEATTYIPFKERVEVTDAFVMSVLDWVAGHPRQVLDATRGADARVVAMGLDPSKAPALGVRFDFASRGAEDVLLEKPGETKSITSRPTNIHKVRMQVYDRFKPTKTSSFPAAYLLPGTAKTTVDLLRLHGIVVERLSAAWSGPAEEFVVSEFKQATRAFQGHRMIELNGVFRAATATAAPGAFLVRTAQPLGILAFHLLEPESLDGAAAWSYLGETFPTGSIFPVIKLSAPPKVAADRVP